MGEFDMKKILLFGDSNTWGHNPVDMTRLPKPWPAVLSELMPQYIFTADGVCGRTTEYPDPNAPDNIDIIGLESFKRRYIQTGTIKEYDLVIIMLGTNDLLNSSNSEPNQIAESLKKFADAVKSSSDAQVMIISPILIKKSCMQHPVFSTLYSMKSVKYSEENAKYIENMTKQENLHFLNAALFAEPSDIDGIHLDLNGHRKLAFAVMDKINEIF